MYRPNKHVYSLYQKKSQGKKMNSEDGSITVLDGSACNIRFVTGVNCATEILCISGEDSTDCFYQKIIDIVFRNNRKQSKITEDYRTVC